MRVLLVEDEPDIREMMSVFLESCGYEVSTAKNGLDALNALTLNRPDVILLDLMMPVMSGWEFLARLKRTSKTPPVIITTAAPPETTPAGAVAVVSKPVSFDLLIKTIERAVH